MTRIKVIASSAAMPEITTYMLVLSLIASCILFETPSPMIARPSAICPVRKQATLEANKGLQSLMKFMRNLGEEGPGKWRMPAEKAETRVHAGRVSGLGYNKINGAQRHQPLTTLADYWLRISRQTASPILDGRADVTQPSSICRS